MSRTTERERESFIEQRLTIVVSSASDDKLNGLNNVEITSLAVKGDFFVLSSKEHCLIEDGQAVAQELRRLTTDE